MDDFDNKYKKKNPFSVPERYFDTLNDRIMAKVNEREKLQKIKLIRIVKPYIGLVGIFLLAMFMVQVIFPLFVDQDKMLMKKENKIVQVQDVVVEEETLDSYFNPTNEEIIEYLSTELNTYELFYAELY